MLSTALRSRVSDLHWTATMTHLVASLGRNSYIFRAQPLQPPVEILLLLSRQHELENQAQMQNMFDLPPAPNLEPFDGSD